MNRRNLFKGVAAAGSATAATAFAGTSPARAEAPRSTTPVPEPIPEQAPATEGYVDVPGGRLWYWDTGGRGPAVVLVHAASGSGESWPYQQPVLAAAGYRVIGYSRRGHYRSSPFAAAEAPAGADDLGALVDRLGLGRFHLVSSALGGFYATDYALLHPDRVRSHLVISSFMGIQEPDFTTLIEGLRPPEFGPLPAYFKELSPSYRAANPEGLARWQEIADRARLPGSGYLHRVVSDITWATLGTMTTRTSLVTGDSDLYMPPPVMRLVARHIDGAGTLVFPEVGHCAHWESPSALNRALLRFLRGARIGGVGA